jgi:hypothetical protein
MLREHREAPDEKKRQAADLILTKKDLKGIEKILTNSGVLKTVVKLILPGTSGYQNASMDAGSMSESDFMQNFGTLLVDEPVLAEAATTIGEHIIQELRKRVHVLASDCARLVARVELDTFMQHQLLRANAIGHEARLASRVELLESLRQDLTQNGSSW